MASKTPLARAKKHAVASHSAALKAHKTEGLNVNMSNALNQAAHRLSLSEKRIVMFAVAKIDSLRAVRPDDPPTLRITASEYAELFNLHINTAYDELQSAGESLFNRYIGFPVKTRTGVKIENVRWVGRATYHKGEAWIELKFWHEIIPLLVMIGKKFTSYKLSQAGALRSVHTWRLLELLSQFRDSGWRQDELTDFVTAMGVAETTYAQNFAQLRRWVIEPAVKELAEKDGWEIDWNPIKMGRKVVALRFEFQRSPQGSLPL